MGPAVGCWALGALLLLLPLLALYLSASAGGAAPPSAAPAADLHALFPAASAALPGAAPLQPPCTALAYLYADTDFIVELPFLLSLLEQPRAACGACLRLRHRRQLLPDLAAGALGCAATILAATWELTQEELAGLRAHSALARERLILVHLSDEFESRPVAGYDLPRVVLRNYYSAAPDRVSDLSYLQEDAPSPPPPPPPPLPAGAPPPVLFLPLGHGDAFLPHLAPALALPARARRLAWSWAGSTHGKPERAEFVEGLRASPASQALLAAGSLQAFAQWQGAGALRPAEYTAQLLESRVAPCPAGGSPEQFRVWEALLAGAVPLVRRGAAHLRYLAALGFEALEVEQWGRDAPALLLSAASDAYAQGTLEPMQAVNARALARVLARLRARLAAEVCAAVGRACAAGGAQLCSALPQGTPVARECAAPGAQGGG
jgi:hypothetical protein